MCEGESGEGVFESVVCVSVREREWGGYVCVSVEEREER